MVNTLSEIQVPLVFGIGDHLKLVLRAVIWPVYVDSCFEVHQRLAQGSAGHRTIVEPGKEVPGCDVVVEDVFQASALGSREVKLLQSLLRVAAGTVWQDTLCSGMNRVSDHALVDQNFESFDFQEGGMDSKGRSSTRLTGLSQVNKTVAGWPT